MFVLTDFITLIKSVLNIAASKSQAVSLGSLPSKLKDVQYIMTLNNIALPVKRPVKSQAPTLKTLDPSDPLKKALWTLPNGPSTSLSGPSDPPPHLYLVLRLLYSEYYDIK